MRLTLLGFDALQVSFKVILLVKYPSLVVTRFKLKVSQSSSHFIYGVFVVFVMIETNYVKVFIKFYMLHWYNWRTMNRNHVIPVPKSFIQVVSMSNCFMADKKWLSRPVKNFYKWFNWSTVWIKAGSKHSLRHLNLIVA